MIGVIIYITETEGNLPCWNFYEAEFMSDDFDVKLTELWNNAAVRAVIVLKPREAQK